MARLNEFMKQLLSSTLSGYTQTHHTRRERISSAMDVKLKSIHGAWIPAIHAGMTILRGVMMKSDKVELENSAIPSPKLMSGEMRMTL